MRKTTHYISNVFNLIKKSSYISLTLVVTVFLWSCKKDNNNSTPSYTVPTTYNFTNVNYNNQLVLLAMADQIVAKINLANSIPNTPVSAQTLKDMFNNANAPFIDSANLKLNASGLSLANYCPAAEQTDLMGYFDSIGVYSQSSATASQGVAGVAASSASPTKKYLLSTTGIFYSQVVKKAMMGICAYEIANVYLKDSTSNTIDNVTVITGSGTAMEHAWDEAFGFFGVPINFPTNTTGLRYFGSYSNQVNAGLNSNSTIMNAFLTGRAAISAKDLTTKTAQAAIIVKTLDQLDAASIVQEMKETNTNLEAGDLVAAYGTLSESLGFVRNLSYNTSATRIITSAQIAQLEAMYDSSNPGNPNLYNFANGNIATTDIEVKTNAISQFIGSIYGFSATELLAL